jgi:hypothetical protein
LDNTPLNIKATKMMNKITIEDLEDNNGRP